MAEIERQCAENSPAKYQVPTWYLPGTNLVGTRCAKVQFQKCHPSLSIGSLEGQFGEFILKIVEMVKKGRESGIG